MTQYMNRSGTISYNGIYDEPFVFPVWTSVMNSNHKALLVQADRIHRDGVFLKYT